MFHYGPFRFSVATTDEEIRRAQELRYQVYVQECGFENPEDHPQGRETDPFDDVSIHLLARDAAGQAVGTMRVVLNGPRGLPIFQALSHFNAFSPNSTRLIELSRLAVLPRLRRTSIQDAAYLHSGIHRFPGSSPMVSASQERRNESIITTGLIYLMLVVGIRCGAREILMITEKKLWVMLKRLGILFRPIGEAVEYHGRRIPYLADISRIQTSILDIHRKTLCQFDLLKESVPVGAGA